MFHPDAINYIYTGGDHDDIPDDVTHVTIDESITIIPTELFIEHQSIVELICHDGVKRIEMSAFESCPRLRRVVIPGVEDIKRCAFLCCEGLEHVECNKLERLGDSAFAYCRSLVSINLQSVKEIESLAFRRCEALTEAQFGSNLKKISSNVFLGCRSLERVSFPLRVELVLIYLSFPGCVNLKRIDLVEGALHQFIASLHLEEWKDGMNEEIDSINHILPDIPEVDSDDMGGEATVIRDWVLRILLKVTEYKIHHQFVLNEVASVLRHNLPHEAIMNHVIPFLTLPFHILERDENGEEERNNENDVFNFEFTLEDDANISSSSEN